MEIVILAVVIALVVILGAGGLVIGSRRKKRRLPSPPPSTPKATTPPAEPHIGDEAAVPREEPRRTIEEVPLPGATAAPEEPVQAPAPERIAAPVAIEQPEPAAGRLVRLRSRLSRSQNTLGKGLLTLLSRERLDEETKRGVRADAVTCHILMRN